MSYDSPPPPPYDDSPPPPPYDDPYPPPPDDPYPPPPPDDQYPPPPDDPYPPPSPNDPYPPPPDNPYPPPPEDPYPPPPEDPYPPPPEDPYPPPPYEYTYPPPPEDLYPPPPYVYTYPPPPNDPYPPPPYEDLYPPPPPTTSVTPSPSPLSLPPQASASSKSSGTGVVMGGSISGVALLILAAALIFFVYRRRHGRRRLPPPGTPADFLYDPRKPMAAQPLQDSPHALSIPTPPPPPLQDSPPHEVPIPTTLQLQESRHALPIPTTPPLQESRHALPIPTTPPLQESSTHALPILTTPSLQESTHALPISTTPSSPPPLMLSWQSGSSSRSSLSTASTGSTFAYDELAAATNGFSEANLLGQGGFGHVYKGTTWSGQEVAVKKLRAGSGQGHREFRAEVDIISRVHHKNLVSLAGFCIHDEQRLLVYEHVPNKTLYAHLHSGAGSGRPTLDWTRRWKIAVGSAKGLAYLHDDCHPKIIHRDIKSANILLDYSFEPKVADFGLARCQQAEKTTVSTRVMGTIGYMAPEYAATGKVNDRSDVFSFGVVLLELITGRKPATESSDDDEHETLVSWARPLLARAVEEDNYEDLIDPTLEANYDAYDMTRLVACAAAAVRDTARSRPRMAQIVRYLESELSVEDLKAVMAPGRTRSTTWSEVKQLRKMEVGPAGATGTDEQASSEMSEPASEYTASSGPDTAEMRTGAIGMSAA